jgi:hypothetical protein
MTIFSPDGRYAYICSSFTPETIVVETATRAVVGRVAQPSPFCPNIAASPDGRQVWFTLKDTGRVVAFAATPPFNVLRVIDTGPITNHVNFVRRDGRQLAFVTIGGANRVDVFDTADFTRVASIPVGATPHGVWPSGDGRRVYVGIENEGAVTAIDTTTMRVIGRMAIGQAPQAVVYVTRAVPEDADPAANLAPLGLAASTATLTLGDGDRALTTVALFDQGLTQVVQAVASGLDPGGSYALALAEQRDGGGHAKRWCASPPTPPARRSSTPSDRSARSCAATRPARAAISRSSRSCQTGRSARRCSCSAKARRLRSGALGSRQQRHYAVVTHDAARHERGGRHGGSGGCGARHHAVRHRGRRAGAGAGAGADPG